MYFKDVFSRTKKVNGDNVEVDEEVGQTDSKTHTEALSRHDHHKGALPLVRRELSCSAVSDAGVVLDAGGDAQRRRELLSTASQRTRPPQA